MGSNMTVKVPFFPVISKQLRILGSFRYGVGDYPLAISLVERGLIDLKPLVTQVVEFEQALEAFESTRRGKDENGKVCLFSPFCCSCAP
jgi:L-iditol 2-dehydrogenase/D-xylulose reductase